MDDKYQKVEELLEKSITKEKIPGITHLPDLPQEIKFTKNNVRTKIIERERNRMKLQIKFSKDEAQAFRNYAKVYCPPNMELDDFARFLFFSGMESYNQKIADKLKEKLAQDQEKTEELNIQDPNEVIAEAYRDDN